MSLLTDLDNWHSKHFRGAEHPLIYSQIECRGQVRGGRECWQTQLPGRVDASVCLCATRGGELLACVGAYDGSVYFLRVADGTVRRDCHAA